MLSYSLDTIPASRFWMRSVSFTGLRDLVKLIAKYSHGLLAKEMNSLVQSEKTFTVRNNKIPSPTTIYHYRNTLLHMQILVKKKHRYVINLEKPEIRSLLSVFSNRPTLTSREKIEFAKLVIQQEDCKDFFSDLFWPSNINEYTLLEWLQRAVPVIWREIPIAENRQVLISQEKREKSIYLTTENHINSILYGVRYWFRDELNLIDELFREDIGNIMFPVLPDFEIALRDIKDAIFSSVDIDKEWTRLSVRDMALAICVEHRVSLKSLFQIIRDLQAKHHGYINLIPTARSFATMTSVSNYREKLELRSYLQNQQGQFISHVRIHRKLRELINE